MSYASALRGGRYALTFWKGCRVRSLRFMGASDDRILECVLCVLSLGRLAMWLVGGVRVERSPYRWSAYNLPLRIVCVRKHFLVDDTTHERAETHFFRDTHIGHIDAYCTYTKTHSNTLCPSTSARSPAHPIAVRSAASTPARRLRLLRSQRPHPLRHVAHAQQGRVCSLAARAGVALREEGVLGVVVVRRVAAAHARIAPRQT